MAPVGETMELRVLGCSGGIGNGHRTTSFLLDGEILIDAGSGVGDLTLAELERIRHIFLTHSHLDHIHTIPLLVDTVFDALAEPIHVHAEERTLQALKDHIFNNVIWPDFTRLPHPEQPVLRLLPMAPGEQVILGRRRLEMVRVNHIVPTVGYRVTGPGGVFAFSSDTTTNDSFWQELNRGDRLDLLIVESAFSNSELELCRLARHYCPTLLAADLAKLEHRPLIYLTHAKPGEAEKIFTECRELLGERIGHLTGGEVFRFPL